MPISHGSNRWKVIGANVERLPNERFKVTLNCRTHNLNSDWYYANEDKIFKDFGDAYSLPLENGAGDDAAWSPQTGEAYPNLVLVETQYQGASGSDASLIFVYETLTSTWTLEDRALSTVGENGLMTLREDRVAIGGTHIPFDKDDIGVFTDEFGTDGTPLVGGTQLYIVGIQDKGSRRKGAFTLLWAEAGILSETIDNVGSQKSKVIETIGANPTTPTGYLLASKQESNFEGFQTNRFTFLKPSILSLQQDFNNGLKRVSVQAFSLTASAVSTALTTIIGDHELISQTESDYNGIKTSNFQYQVDESLTEDYELNGLKRIALLELSTSNFVPQIVGGIAGVQAADPEDNPPNLVPSGSPLIGLYLGSQNIDNGGAIRTRESVWVEDGILSQSERQMSEGVQAVTTEFLAAEGDTVGPIYSKNVSNYEGLKTITVVNLQDNAGQSIIGTDEDGEEFEKRVDQYERKSPFTYPGRVQPEYDKLEGPNDNSIDPVLVNFVLDPPVQTKIDATVSVIFQTSPNISANDEVYNDGKFGVGDPTDGRPAQGYWNPTTWATTYIAGIGHNYTPFSETQGLRGYRADINFTDTRPTIGDASGDDNEEDLTLYRNGVLIFRPAKNNSATGYLRLVTTDDTVGETTDKVLGFYDQNRAPLIRINGVADANGKKFLCNGRRIYGYTAFIAEASGGPENPIGNKYVLDIDIRPAFEDIDGKKFYKKTIVTAVIPSNLPPQQAPPGPENA